MTSTRATHLRTLHIVEATLGGLGRHVIDLVTGLDERGHQSTVAYGVDRMDDAFRSAVDAGVFRDAHAMDLRREPAIRDPFDLVRLVRLAISGPRPDIIHGHSSKGGALARALGVLLRVPAVYTPNGYVGQTVSLPPWKRRAYTAVEYGLARTTARIIAVSSLEATSMRSLDNRSGRIQVVPNGHDPAPALPRDVARKQLHLEDGAPTVGFIGRFEPQKNPVEAVRTFSHIARELPAARLVMIGDGTLRGDVENEIWRHNLAEHVVLPGAVPGPDLVSAFDVLLSTAEFEGFPYSWIEAVGAGVPIAAYRVGGSEEFVALGACLEVPQGDVAALAAAGITLLRDKDEYADGIRSAAAGTSVDPMIDRTLAVYRQVLAAAEPSTGRRRGPARRAGAIR